MEPKTIQHDFNAMSIKTSNSKGTKYLGKDGKQAWRVSALIENEWYSAMIYDEALLPKKGTTYSIQLSENEGFLNWAYKTQSKKEQILEQTAPTTEELNVLLDKPYKQPEHASEADIAEMEYDEAGVDVTPPKEPVKDDAYWDNVNRGKTRCQVVCAYIQNSGSYNELDVNDAVDFIFNGK